MNFSNNEYITALRKTIQEAFSEEEFITLCVDLGINYNNISGSTYEAKTREFLASCQRQGTVNDLVAKLKEERPKENWLQMRQTENVTGLKKRKINFVIVCMTNVQAERLKDETAFEGNLHYRAQLRYKKLKDTIDPIQLESLFQRYGNRPEDWGYHEGKSICATLQEVIQYLNAHFSQRHNLHFESEFQSDLFYSFDPKNWQKLRQTQTLFVIDTIPSKGIN